MAAPSSLAAERYHETRFLALCTHAASILLATAMGAFAAMTEAPSRWITAPVRVLIAGRGAHAESVILFTRARRGAADARAPPVRQICRLLDNNATNTAGPKRRSSAEEGLDRDLRTRPWRQPNANKLCSRRRRAVLLDRW